MLIFRRIYCIYAAYGTVYDSSWWPVGTQFMAYFYRFAFRKGQESIQFNTHSRAFHRLFSHVCDVTRYSVKPIVKRNLRMICWLNRLNSICCHAQRLKSQKNSLKWTELAEIEWNDVGSG